jgi:hypothetical protein
MSMDNYILEIPDTVEYTIRDLYRIMNFPDELKNIAEMNISLDPEVRMLGNKLLETMKDVR